MSEGKEFKRNRIKPVDFVPIIGLFTYGARWRGNSIREEIKFSTEGWHEPYSNPSKFFRDLKTMGMEDWPKEPQYAKETRSAALQNSAILAYHVLAPYLAALYAIKYLF